MAVVHDGGIRFAWPTHLKPVAFDAVHDALAVDGDALRILCGDFNSPKAETEFGHVHCHGEADQYHREWQVMDGLRFFGMVDAFRAVNGYGVEAHSHRKPQYGPEWVRRFDHAFVSSSLELEGCRYHMAWLDEGASDHAAIEMDLERDLLDRRAPAPRPPVLGVHSQEGQRQWVRGREWVEGERYLLEVVPHQEWFDPNGWDYVVRCRSQGEARDKHLHERRFRERLVDCGAIEQDAEVVFQWLGGSSTDT